MNNKIQRYEKKVMKVLSEQGFIVGDKEREIINARINNGRRYFFMVANRKEGDRVLERFIKIPENNTKKLLLPFERQIEMALYLKSNNIINTRGVINFNVIPRQGTPYAIMETFPFNKDKIGFIENNNGVEFLTAVEAQKTIDQLFHFHQINVASLPEPLNSKLKKNKGDFKSFKREIIKFLNKKVKPLGYSESEYFHKVLEKRLGITNIKSKLIKIIDSFRSYIDTEENNIVTLIHGDMAPNNLYIFDSGDVEFLDLEWVGIVPNRAIAMIFDFGNLRARSWKNKSFRFELDKALLNNYKKIGKEELGEIIIKLSIIRSHTRLSSYFENYDWAKQEKPDELERRNQTEQDLKMVLE